MAGRAKKNILSIYFFVFIFFSILYLGLFFTPLLQEQKVLFYRGLGLLLIDFFIFLILFLITKKANFYLYFSALVLAFSLNLCFFVIFPVTFERSVTMYLLNTLKTNNGINKIELEDKLVKEYILKNKALDKRLFEQRTTGFVEEENGQVFLTEKGKTFLKFAQLVKQVFNIKDK